MLFCSWKGREAIPYSNCFDFSVDTSLHGMDNNFSPKKKKPFYQNIKTGIILGTIHVHPN